MITKRSDIGALVGGVVLIGLGLLFLLGQFFNLNVMGWLWPFFVIGVGAVFFIGMLAAGKSAAGLAIPGSIFTGLGLLLFFQNLTGRWESWAYAWTIFPTAVGVGLYIMGAWADNPSQRQAGLNLARIGVILFIVFGAFFELLIFGNGGTRQFLFPALLIALGLYLLVTRIGPWPRRPTKPSDPNPPQGGETGHTP